MKQIREMWRRLLFRLRRRELERELAEEMRFHLEMKAEANRADGLSEKDAAWAARRQFGNVTRMAEQCRDMWGWSGLERFGKDVRVSLRGLRREAGFTMLAVLTLGLGIGATTAVFSVIRGVLLSPLPYQEPGRLIAIWQNRLEANERRNPVSYPNFKDWQEQSRSFEAMAAASVPATMTLDEPEPDALPIYLVDPSFLQVLGVQKAAQGRLFQKEDFGLAAHPVALLSYASWQGRFGRDPNIIGRQLKSNGAVRTIVGVLPASYRQPPLDYRGREPELLFPQEFSVIQRREAGVMDVIARLKPGVTAQQAAAEMAAIGQHLAKQYPENRGMGVETARLEDVVVGKARGPLWLLFGAVGVLLLCACLNMANMLLARSMQRRPEFAIRAALGGRRGLLFGQVIAEGLTLSLMGALVGAGLAEVGVRWMVRAAGAMIPRSEAIRVDGTVLLFTLGVACAAGVLFALAPALFSAHTDGSEALKHGARTGEARGVGRMRLVLVGSEIAMAVVLLAGSGLLMRSFWHVLQVNMGFDPQDVLTAEVAVPARPGFVPELLGRVARLPGVQAAGAAGTVPLALSPTAEVSITIRNRPAGAGETRTAGVVAATPGYFPAMRIGLRRGRIFDDRDGARQTEVALVNESFVRRYLAGVEPVGQVVEIGMNGQSFVMGVARIVGVVADVRQTDVLAEAPPQIWKPHAQCAWPFMTLAVLTAGAAPDLPRLLRQEMKAMGGQAPLTRIRPAGEYYRDALAQRRVSLLLLGVLAGLALVLSAVGVYGVIAYSVMRRRREIGIRMAMGAQAGDVLGMVMRQGLAVTGVGLAAGTMAALGLTGLLESMLYGVRPYDPWTFGLVAVVFLAVAGAASYFPGRGATRMNPMAALRLD